jgi:monofunctional biosynthetic peptidoglycan transglycosylase
MRRRRFFRLPRLLRRLGRTAHWTLRIILVLLVLDLAYLTYIWPDWDKLAAGPVPRSNFIQRYEETRAQHKGWPAVAWQPVPLSRIPRHMQRAVLVAEDSRFYTHSGLDLIAIREAVDRNLAEGEFRVGGSTISQQTVKNLFLTPARTPLRKWHELVLTWGMERNLKKRRILEIYLNIAEFGRGIYGVEAAAEAYWGIPAAELTVFQAAELAATLPGPTKHNPDSRSPHFVKRSQKILHWLAREVEAAIQPPTEPVAVPTQVDQSTTAPVAVPMQVDHPTGTPVVVPTQSDAPTQSL